METSNNVGQVFTQIYQVFSILAGPPKPPRSSIRMWWSSLAPRRKLSSNEDINKFQTLFIDNTIIELIGEMYADINRYSLRTMWKLQVSVHNYLFRNPILFKILYKLHISEYFNKHHLAISSRMLAYKTWRSTSEKILPLYTLIRWRGSWQTPETGLFSVWTIGDVTYLMWISELCQTKL